jgi:hypothetical protein
LSNGWVFHTVPRRRDGVTWVIPARSKP